MKGTKTGQTKREKCLWSDPSIIQHWPSRAIYHDAASHIYHPPSAMIRSPAGRNKRRSESHLFRKLYCGILKHFDAQRKCGYIYSPDAEESTMKMGVFRDRPGLGVRLGGSTPDETGSPLDTHWMIWFV